MSLHSSVDRIWLCLIEKWLALGASPEENRASDRKFNCFLETFAKRAGKSIGKCPVPFRKVLRPAA